MANKHLSAGDETLRRLLAGVGFDDDESASALVSGLFSPISASEARNASASSGGRRAGGGSQTGGGGGFGGGGEGEED